MYTKDPDKDPNAKLLKELYIDDFVDLIAKQTTKAGQYPLFDYTAVQFIRRSRIALQFINGIKPDNLSKAISGKQIGTLITH